MVENLGDILSITGILNNFQLKDFLTIITVIIIATIVIRIIIYKEINKINNELKRLDEKLNIYQKLAIIEEKLGI